MHQTLIVVLSLSVMFAAAQQNIRIAGRSNNVGRIEIIHEGEWYSVCDDSFYTPEAKAACRQLGFKDVTSTNTEVLREFGGGEGDIILDNVDCSGNEESLLDCSHNNLFDHNCDHSADVGVACEIPQKAAEIEVRLRDGAAAREGRLEVKVMDVWGSVCSSGFTVSDAEVVCRQLGIAGRAEVLADFGAGTGPVVLHDVSCSGSESFLAQCQYGRLFESECSSSNSVGIRCGLPGLCPKGNYGAGGTEPCTLCAPGTYQDQEGQESCISCVDGLHGPEGATDAVSCYTIRLEGGSSYVGRIGLYDNGGWHTVCDDYFSSQEARVTCRQLGFNTSRSVHIREYGGGSGNIILDNVDCSGSERNLIDCEHNALYSHNCDHDDDIAVACDVPEFVYDMPMRLVSVGNMPSTSGRVEVHLLDIWGTVCTDLFDVAAAEVVCRALRIPGRANVIPNIGGGEGAIVLDDVQCTGTEAGLHQCEHSDLFEENCDHSQDVGVACALPGLCPVGNYGEVNGEDPCALCEPTYYQDEEGQTECKPCPEGQTSPPGASTIDACYTPSTGILDPHFMITDQTTKTHLCFDYNGRHGDVIYLLEDKENDISVKGSLFNAASDTREHMTYFSDIIITSTENKVVFTQTDITVNSQKVPWNMSEPVIRNDVVLSTGNKPDTILVELASDGVSFMVHRGFGPNVGHYLGVYVVQIEGLSHHTTGIVGQFVKSSFELQQNSGIDYMHIVSTNEELTIPVTLQERFSPTNHGLVPCWFYITQDADDKIIKDKDIVRMSH